MIIKNPAAVALGSIGGRSTSETKRAAAAANGRKSAGRPTLRQQAAERVDNTPALAARRDYIMADWPEGQDHWRWVIAAPVAEILEWVAAGQ